LFRPVRVDFNAVATRWCSLEQMGERHTVSHRRIKR
jgi:hypothetical protein